IKLVPGAGTAVAAPISATVAGTFTYAMGHAWLRVCERLSRGELGAVGGALDGDSIRRVFLEEFKTQATRRRLGS
ncbi:MAG TPA: GTP-binding protein, partial [Nocardioides sp.]|nr:GTP-binding protein [Nocardioides sp.]